MYQKSFPIAAGPQDFPVKGCKRRVTIRTGHHVNFLHRHVWDTVIIVEELNLPHPRCPRCDMMVTCTALNGRHPNTVKCKKGAERKQHGLAVEELRESTEQYFRSYL